VEGQQARSGGPLLTLVSRKPPIPGPRSQQHGKLFCAFAALEGIPGFAKLRANAYVHLPNSFMTSWWTDASFAVSTPFSYSCRRTPKDAEDQLEAISGAAHAIRRLHGTQFTVSSVSPFVVGAGR
jgi:hypothetical protein